MFLHALLHENNSDYENIKLIWKGDAECKKNPIFYCILPSFSFQSFESPCNMLLAADVLSDI